MSWRKKALIQKAWEKKLLENKAATKKNEKKDRNLKAKVFTNK